MATLEAALASLLTVWALNRLALSRLGNAALVLTGPVVEEAAKTLWALALGGSILVTHLFFGMGEAMQEIRVNRREGFLPGFLSIATHFVFGAASFAAWAYFKNPYLALLPGILLHLGWNRGVRLFAAGKGNK